MKQMRSAWYLVVAVLMCSLLGQGVMRAETVVPVVVVPLSTSVSTYLAAIRAVSGQQTFPDTYNACLPLSSAAPTGTTDLGDPVVGSWYRVVPQDLMAISTALTNAATLLLQRYAAEDSDFANLYNDPTFQSMLLNVNSPLRPTDATWAKFISDSTHESFANVFTGLRIRRDFFKAAIDPTTLANSSACTPANIVTIKALLVKPALAGGVAGIPLSGDLVAARIDVGGTRQFLKVVKTDDGFVLLASGTDPLDVTSQFKVAVDFDSMGLQLTTPEALYLTADNVVGDAGWLPSKKQKATRLAFSGTAFSTSSLASGKFALEFIPGSGVNGSSAQFLMRSLNFNNKQSGYVKVDLSGDLSVRAIDPASNLNPDGTFVSYAQADSTPFSFVKITNLHRSLSALRAVSDVPSRVAGYSALFDGSTMATLEDFLLVVSETQNYLDSCRSDANAWKLFQSLNGVNLVRTLIQKMRQNMVSAPSGGGVAAATSAYAQQNNAVSALEVSLNAGMSATAAGARFADGSSIKDALIVISTVNGTMLSVGDGGIISVIPRDLVDQSGQFFAEVDSAGNVNFRSAAAGNKSLQAGAVAPNVQGWLLKARTDISRGSCLREQAGPAEKFILTAQGAALGTYAFKNVESLGYLRIDTDNMVRSLDPSGTSSSMLANQSVQTVFSFVPIDSFIQKLSELRLETQDQERVAGYMELASKILTDSHVNLLLQEVNSLIARAVKSRTQWATWQTAGLDKTLQNLMSKGLQAYSDRAAYSTINALLAAGYKQDATIKDTTGLVAGDVIILRVDGQDNAYLQVQADGTFMQVIGANYFLDPACQLVIAKKPTDASLVEFQSIFLNNFMLRAPDIAVPANAVADLLEDRLSSMSRAKFDGPADASADFEVISSAAGTSSVVGEGVAFSLKRHGKDGFLKIGADSFARFFDDTSTSTVRILPPVVSTASTKISYSVVSSLQKKLTNLRGIVDDAARVVGYRGVLGNIITLGDLKLLLFELQYYIQQPRTDDISYTSFKNVQAPLTLLLTQVSTSFANSLKQLDAKSPNIDFLTKLLAVQLVQNIPAAFGKLATADRVTRLEAMFPSLTTADQASEFLALFGLTMADRSMFTDAILTRMKALYAAILLNNFTKLNVSTVSGGTKELDFWATQLNTPVKFSDVLGILIPLADVMKNTQPASLIDDVTKTKFVAYSAALLNLLGSSSDDERATAIALIESAAYTYLNDRRVSIISIDNVLKSYVKPQNVPATYSAQLDALSVELKALVPTSPSSAMDQFLSDATRMVGGRVQALDADIARLRGILDDALWHPLVLNQPTVSGAVTRYDAQINALINLVKVQIPYLDLIQNLTEMLDKNPSFAGTDITYFMARANQLVSSQASQKDPSVIDAAVKILTRGSRYQVNAQRAALEQIISQLGSYRASLSGAAVKTYLQKLNDLKSQLSVLDSQASTRALTDVEVQSFFDALQVLVDNRLDGTPSQISNLVAWLSSSVVNTSRLVFSKVDGISQIQKIISVLQAVFSVSDRFANLQLLLKNNPQFADSQLKLDFIEKANALATPDARQQAATEKFDIRTNLTQLLVFAKANQFVGDSARTTGAQLLDGIITQLSAPLNQVLGSGPALAGMLLNFAKLDFASQAAALDRGVSEIVDKATATTYLSFLVIAVANRISAQDADVVRLKKVIAAAIRAPGFIDNAANTTSIQTSRDLLDQPLVFSDYLNAINVIVSAFPADFTKITSDTKTLLVTYAQKMADNLVSSADQTARNTANITLKKLAFNQLDDRSSELLKACDIIEAYLPSEQVGQKYTQAITAEMPKIDALTTSSLPAFVTSLKGLVNRRAEGVSSDYDLLKQIIDKLTWNSLVQKEVGQATLKALTALTTLLNQPIPAGDLINLLTARLANQSFTVDDISYFQNKAQAFVDGRAAVTDKAVLDQAIGLLNRASRYQMASKRADLDGMVATLQAQQQLFVQQVYVSYGDQVAQMQARLTDLDTKAQAQQLSADDAAAFLKDLESLVNDRAQAIVANITVLKTWLQAVVSQSRLFFVTKGAKDKAVALLATLQQPVSYNEQYNYLVGLLRDYPNFSSIQMSSDFLDKCTYLASDAGKQQAIVEGFDYKKLADILAFAGQNQLSAPTDNAQVVELLGQLNKPLPAGQVLAKTFNDNLMAQEAAITGLKDTGTVLVDFVAGLEALVSARLYGNNAELARLSQLLQKAQWNGAIRQSAQSVDLLAQVQACLDNFNKPVLFADESAHLITLSKLPLVSPDDQDRFLDHLTKLVSIKEQTADANALDQVIAAIKVVAFNQLQKRAELAPLIAQLDAYRGKMTQQTYVSYSDKITQIQARLSDLDSKAKAQQLADGDAVAFLKDLEVLINARAQGVAADITAFAKWLQGVIPQSRLLFVTLGAKDKATVLLATLQQPVSYNDQYNYLLGVLRDYSTFSSPQMTKDFLDKSIYLASDAGKLQAVAEGFDYKKLAETLTFAAQNQVQSSKTQVNDLLLQLNKVLPEGQVAAKTFNDNLTDQEAAIVGLKDAEAGVFVTALEGLVSARLYGNNAELARLSQLLQKAQWSASIRQSSQSSALLARAQACLDNFNKPVFFADVSAHIITLSKLALVNSDDQDRFVAHLTKLVSIKEQAADANALDQVITAIKVVAFNQLQKRTELAPLIAQLDVYRGKMTQQTYVSYATQIQQIQARLVDLDVKAKAQQLSAADGAAFFKDLESLINARAQGVAADAVALATWLQGVIPQSRLFFVTQGAKDKGAGLILVLQKPVSYVDQYNFLAGLLRDYSTFVSSQMIEDFLAKCAYLVSDDGKKQAQSEGFDYKKLGDILTFAGQNQLSAPADKLRLDAYFAQLNMVVSDGRVVIKTFSDKLTDQETAVAGLIDAGSNLDVFVSALEALVAGRLDGNDTELARLSQLLQKAQWNGIIRQSSQSAKLLARIQTCLDNLAKPVLFADASAYLIGLSKLPLTLPDQQDRFISHVTKLVFIKDQASNADALDQVLTAIKVVAYNQLQKRTELPPLVSQIEGYKSQMGQETVLSFTQEIADLTNRANALTAGAVDKFLVDLSDAVKGRFEAAPDQLQGLASLVNTVAWLNIIRGDKTKGYSKLVDALVKETARVPSFAERLADLSGMLAGTDVLNDVLQESFVQRAQQLLAAKSNATNAQLITIIQTLKVAIFNQIKNKAQELQDILNTFTRYQQNIQITGGLSFGDRIKALQQRLPSLTQQGLADFRQQVSDLFDARVDGADDEIALFKTLLQAAVWNNVVVSLKASGSSAVSDDFTNWYNTVDAPIDFIIWKQSLAQMLLSDTLPSILQQQFMFKVGKLIAAIPRANTSDLQDAQTMLIQASYNQLSSRKADLDLAVGKLKDAANSQSVGPQLSFSERVNSLKVQLAKLSKASVQGDIDAFVKNVSDLIDARVDAISDDLKALQAWLLSNDVQNNEAIYFHQGADPLMKLAATVLNPVSYGLRAQNLMTLVKNNTTFTDIQKGFVQAKVQLLVDQRAQASSENFALSDVVKIIQFVIDRRLDKNADGIMIARLNSAIYALQSGSVGTLRLRYGAQVDQVKTSLVTLLAADIPKFVASVKALVDGRADGTADLVNSLRDWLVGTDVQANKVLFFAPQKADLQKLAVTLQSPPPYLDRYNNLRQMLQDYPVFDPSSDIVKEFMAKALILVSERGRAAAERLDLQYIKDLFVFAIQNRLAGDDSSTTILRQYIDALTRPADEAVATGSSQPFAQRITDLQAQFKAATQTNFSEFVSALSQLVGSRVDGTDAEITLLKTWLTSNEVQNSRLVFLQGGLAQIQPLINKIDVVITFAQRVDNLRVMIQNTATFSSTDQMLFFAKVDKLIAERWRAAQENYNIDDLVKLLQFVQVNQFSEATNASRADLITTKITALRTAPDQLGPVVKYIMYPDRIVAIQNQFIQIGSMQKDLATMKQLVADINQLVVDRVDGLDSDRANLVTFIRSRVLYHQLVYGVSEFEQAFQKNIDGLVAPITYGELYANFKKLLTVSVYSDDHKKLFISKLQTLVVNRGDAVKASVDLAQLVRDITFAKINKFSQEILDDQRSGKSDRNLFIKQIEDLSAQLLIAPVATLAAAIAKVQAEITNLSAENWAAAGPEQKRGLLARLRVLANNVDETSLPADRDAIDTLLATAKTVVFRGDEASRALLEQYRATIQQGGSMASGTAEAVSGAGATAP